MAAQTPYPSQTNNILFYGKPRKSYLDVEAATNMYPGRILGGGTYDTDVIVNTGVLPPVGWLGYEGTRNTYKKDSVDTIYTINDEAVVYGAGNYAIRAKLAAYFTAVRGDYVIPWSNGRVAPVALLKGIPHLRVPFTTSTAETDTGIDLVSQMAYGLAQVYITTAEGGKTMDVGILSSEGGGDADGIVDGISLATAGWASHNLVDATAGNLTSGALIEETVIIDATGTPVYTPILKEPGHICDGTAVSLTYTGVSTPTAVAGYIFLPIVSLGTVVVGKIPYGLAKATSDQNITVENLLV